MYWLDRVNLMPRLDGPRQTTGNSNPFEPIQRGAFFPIKVPPLCEGDTAGAMCADQVLGRREVPARKNNRTTLAGVPGEGAGGDQPSCFTGSNPATPALQR